MKDFQLIYVGLLALLLAACGTTPLPDPEPESASTAAGMDDGASTGGFDDGGLGAGESIPDDTMGEPANVIYFDFDKSDVRAEFSDDISRHANRLANNSRMSIRLEGHADERGSREYNIGLGERRSQAVRRMLLIQGASASQISTVSFGEERPVAFGSDEESWAQNRRVEIKVLN